MHKKTDSFIDDISNRLWTDFFTEIRDPKKKAVDHLSSQNGSLYYKMSEKKKCTKIVNAYLVNNPCESTFGVHTDKIVRFNNSSCNNAGVIAVIKKNGNFNSGHKK